MSEKAKYRRYQNMLSLSGVSIIMMGAWDVIKIIMIMMFDREGLYSFLNIDESATLLITITVICIIVLVLFILWIKIKIGRAANAEAKGEKGGYKYIIASAILIPISLPNSSAMLDGDAILKAEEICGYVLDTVACIILFEIVVSGIMVKKYRKKGYE